MGWGLKQLNDPSEFFDFNEPPAVSRLMHWAWFGRKLNRLFPLDSSAGRRRFALWFLFSGRRSLSIRDGWVTDFRDSPRWLDRAIRALFGAFGPALAAAGSLLPFPLRRWLLRMILDGVAPLVDVGSIPPAASRMVQAAPSTAWGVTLVGYARAELGLGEYMRNSAQALEAAEVPLAVLDCSQISSHRKADDRLVRLIRDRSPFPINLIHVTADRMFDACVSFPTDALLGRYNIGVWMWELPRFPAELLQCAGFLDEIWAPTSFVYASLSESPVPVHHMPVCVTAELHRTPSRAEFGLDEKRFLFVFSFDAYSFIARKNPSAVIRAFRRAFPRGDEAAGLVLKVMNANRHDPRWQTLLADIKADPRIKVITKTLLREDWLGLLSLCDAYVSLHRSEGFGYGPAEAMCLGKPVILTGYGGVTDFARPDTALLVEHRLVPVQPGQYHFANGQVWADPDIEHAARHMRNLVEDRELAHRIGMAGRDFVQRHHAPAVVGRAYLNRLRDCIAEGSHRQAQEAMS